jgi:hypothetical protein
MVLATWLVGCPGRWYGCFQQVRLIGGRRLQVGLSSAGSRTPPPAPPHQIKQRPSHKPHPPSSPHHHLAHLSKGPLHQSVEGGPVAFVGLPGGVGHHKLPVAGLPQLPVWLWSWWWWCVTVGSVWSLIDAGGQRIWSLALQTNIIIMMEPVVPSPAPRSNFPPTCPPPPVCHGCKPAPGSTR